MKNIQKKISAFTLIELLVVIVIIGILATISTATFGGYSSKALISKYRAERQQAAKEGYEECLSVNEEYECFPVSLVYRNTSDGGKLYKKDVNSPDLGSAITSVSAADPTYSPDGKYIVYRNNTNGFLYKKSPNDTGNGIAITSVSATDPTYSPDGKFIVYTNTSDGFLYKKNADDSTNGSAITSVSGGAPTYSPDGKFIIYRSGPYYLSSYLYKKDASTSSNGELLITEGNMAQYSGIYSPYGVFIYYLSSFEEATRKKRADDKSIGEFFSLINMPPSSILPNGDFLSVSSAGGGDLMRVSPDSTVDNPKESIIASSFPPEKVVVFPW